MNILYIACSCSPIYGSEDAIGWNIPLIAENRNNKVTVIVRSGLKHDIKLWIKNHPDEKFPNYYFIETSSFLDKIAKGPFYTMRLYEFSFRALKLAKRLNKIEPFDIIHQITPVEFRSIGDYGKISNAKYIIGPIAGGQKINKLLWNYVDKKNIEKLRVLINEITIKNPLYKKKIKKANCVLFANRETLDYFCQNSLATGREIVIPEIGVKNQYNRQNCNKTNEQIIFLMVGRLISIKGFDIVLDSLEYIKNKNFKIRICGDGELYNHFLDKIKNKNLSENVELLGFIDYLKMEQEYKTATALIMPSLREATGTVLIEAMQHGIPVITFEQFGAKLIIDDESGWCISIEDSQKKCVEQVASIMEKIINNPKIAMEKGRKAMKKISDFTWEKKYDLYEKLYKQLLNGKASKKD